jgi:hypothetical protein
MRRVVIGCVWAALGLLVILSIAGAFLGPARSKVLFNSVPLAVFWFLLVVLLVVGVLAFQRLRRSPGLLAMHVGSLLVLGGAMWGSDAGHEAAARLLGESKIPSGYMLVVKGETTDLVFADTNDFDPAQVIGRLPFSLRLADFRMTYYPPSRKQWDLVVVAPCSTREMQKHDDGERVATTLNWVAGEDVEIPFTKARLTVLQYLPSARPVYDETKPTLEIVVATGRTTSLSPEVGQQATLADLGIRVGIVQVFSNLRVQGMGKAIEVVDAGGLPENPALKVEVEWPDGKKAERYVMARFPMHGEPLEGMRLKYRWPAVVGAEPDPHSESPAMEVWLRGEGQEKRAWLIPGGPGEDAQISLAPWLGSAEGPGAGQKQVEREAAGPELLLVAPMGEVKSYQSDLAVLDKGRLVQRQMVEVNHPLHYAGYHLYQHSFDKMEGAYTVLSVASDSGLWAVYAGFILLVVGVFWQFWAEAVLPRITDGNKHGA